MCLLFKFRMCQALGTSYALCHPVPQLTCNVGIYLYVPISETRNLDLQELLLVD